MTDRQAGSGGVSPQNKDDDVPPRKPVIAMENLSKLRAKGDNAFELSIPTIKVWPGEFVAVVGESGCGKSTMLDMLGLVMKPTRAVAFNLNVAGQEYCVMDMTSGQLAGVRRTGLGYILQTGGLLPFLNVLDNILLPCRINGLRDREEHVLQLCNRLKIVNQIDKKPQFLSGGQRQRVAIARALAHQPPLVLADEPTAAVDKLTALEIRDTFKELTREMNVTVLMVTHDVDLVMGVADRCVTFDVSRISQTQTRSICREKEWSTS